MNVVDLLSACPPPVPGWRRPQPVSRLAEGHPQGVALTPARTAPCFRRAGGRDHACRFAVTQLDALHERVDRSRAPPRRRSVHATEGKLSVEQDQQAGLTNKEASTSPGAHEDGDFRLTRPKTAIFVRAAGVGHHRAARAAWDPGRAGASAGRIEDVVFDRCLSRFHRPVEEAAALDALEAAPHDHAELAPGEAGSALSPTPTNAAPGPRAAERVDFRPTSPKAATMIRAERS